MTVRLRVDLDAVTKDRIQGPIKGHEGALDKLAVKEDTHRAGEGRQRSRGDSGRGKACGRGKRACNQRSRTKDVGGCGCAVVEGGRDAGKLGATRVAGEVKPVDRTQERGTPPMEK